MFILVALLFDARELLEPPTSTQSKSKLNKADRYIYKHTIQKVINKKLVEHLCA
jgi:hypothetical protein